MNSELYRRAREVFVRAIDMESAQRERMLERDCAGDTTLRREVDSLLAAHESGRGFGSVAGARAAPIEVVRLPERIGNYRILDILGEGGMGVVYEAEQANPRRVVALKVLHPGVASPSRARRFEHEAQILGRLHHPGIAQVYEAATADTGAGPQPYLAMELVEGRPLVEHANAEGLGARERVELLVLVCRAVHHAHERGVIHRDLKPANILVDAQGAPKVLDFGIARATADGLETRTMLTSAGEVLGTLPYMSPEQLDAEGAEIDARSDVYALGVIGYELLAGRLPIDVSRQSLPDAARCIREDLPVPLGSAVRALRGDVETILAKALEKERERRYATAHELAEDLERWLRQEPIVARPASTMYQLSRFARRHRVLVGGVAGVIVALVLGIVATIWQAREARAAARRAIAELEFFQDALTSVTPDAAGRAVPMLMVVDGAARSLESAFPGEPLIEQPLQQTIGVIYRTLGRMEESERHLRRAVELARVTFGPDAAATIQAETELADTLVTAETLDEGEALARRAVDRSRRARGGTGLEEIPSVIILARALAARGKFEEAGSLLENGLAVRRKQLGDADTRTVESICELALLRLREGKAEQGMELLREGLALQEHVAKEKPSLTLAMMNSLANALMSASRPEEAREMLEKVIERARALFGEDDYRPLMSTTALASVLAGMGRVDEAAELQEKTLATARKSLGPTHIVTLGALEYLAEYRAAQGRKDEAVELAREWVEGCARNYGETDGQTLDAQFELAKYLALAGLISEADGVVDHVLEISRTSFATGDPMRVWFEGVRHAAYLLMSPARLEEAEKLLDEAWPRIEAAFGPSGERTRYALQVRMQVYSLLGKSQEAEEIQRRLARGE